MTPTFRRVSIQACRQTAGGAHGFCGQRLLECQNSAASRYKYPGRGERGAAVRLANVSAQATLLKFGHTFFSRPFFLPNSLLLQGVDSFRCSSGPSRNSYSLNVTLKILMSSYGLSSFGFVFTLPMACTTSMPRTTRPNTVCLLSSQGCGTRRAKSDQFQSPPAASPKILHHTV